MLGPIVTACDDRFAMPLATALRSIVDTNRSGWPLEFFVLVDEFSESARNKVVSSLPPGTAAIRWMPVDLQLYEEFGKANYSKIAYARCLLPEIFPETISKVLYLDADIVVLDDLRPLWETDLEGCVLGAVEDGINELLQKTKLVKSERCWIFLFGLHPLKTFDQGRLEPHIPDRVPSLRPRADGAQTQRT